MHDGPTGGHYGRETTAHKIVRAGYYWPKVLRYLDAYAHKCKVWHPDALIFDNTSYFSSLKLTESSIDKSIHISYAADYYPEGNGVAKSSNKNLICIICKSVVDNQRNWHNALTNSLWADRLTPKVALGKFPYFLFYGQHAILPPNITLPSLQLSQASRGTPLALLQERINQLMRLEQLREKARIKFKNHQMIVKR
eukprot:PITA_05932